MTTGLVADGQGGARVTWLGHATVLLEIRGVRILTDPVLRERVGVLCRRHDLPRVDELIGAGELERVDAVLLSHLHHDHADLPSLRRVRQAPVVTERENGRWVRRQGLLAPTPDPDGWHSVGGDVQVGLVPAVHAARPMPHRPNGAVGMLVRAPGVVVWFAGDTSLYPEMADLPELAGGPIDVALLPIGGWGPRLSAGHMGPVEAAEAAALSGAATVVPIHFGTLHPRGWPAGRLGWTTAPGERLSAVVAQRSSATAQVLPVGGTLTVRSLH